MVMKTDGGWRQCGNFCHLNLVTEPDAYSLPNMLDYAAKVAGCTVFSKIDLRKGYHEIPANPADVQKTAHHRTILALRVKEDAFQFEECWGFLSCGMWTG
jgi:hypothetical protein